MTSNDPSYQSKEGYYPPQQTASGAYSNAGALNAGKTQDYEILEAGQRFNDDAGAGLSDGPWTSNADVEKQLRLGESYPQVNSKITANTLWSKLLGI